MPSCHSLYRERRTYTLCTPACLIIRIGNIGRFHCYTRMSWANTSPSMSTINDTNVNRIGDGIAVGTAVGAAVGAIKHGSNGILEKAVAGAICGGLYRVAVIVGERTGFTRKAKRALRLD